MVPCHKVCDVLQSSVVLDPVVWRRVVSNRIRDAYEVLSDETSRKQYNQQLMLSGPQTFPAHYQSKPAPSDEDHDAGYRPKTPPGSKPKGQELGMSQFEFYIVV